MTRNRGATTTWEWQRLCMPSGGPWPSGGPPGQYYHSNKQAALSSHSGTPSCTPTHTNTTPPHPGRTKGGWTSACRVPFCWALTHTTATRAVAAAKPNLMVVVALCVYGSGRGQDFLTCFRPFRAVHVPNYYIRGFSQLCRTPDFVVWTTKLGIKSQLMPKLCRLTTK